MRLKIFLMLFLLCPLLFAKPLPEKEAFQFSTGLIDANNFQLDWTLKKGYFLYQKRIRIQNIDPQFLTVGTLTFPEHQIKLSQGKNILIFRDQLHLKVPILATQGGEFLIEIHYQGCSDEGFCYPPQMRQLKLAFDKEHALTHVSEIDHIEQPITDSIIAQKRNPSSEILAVFNQHSPFWIMLSFFGFGLLLAFTPCILPMVPVLSGIIIGHGHQISTRKAFLLSLSYVFSMAVTYGIIGASIALLGANLQVMMQSPWAIISFAGIFMLLALFMFDVYEFRLPHAWQSRLTHLTKSQSGGHYINAGIMGALSILILSPCVTPPLIGALTYIANTGSAWIGLMALFFLGLGMGTPLLLLGASAGKLLPKTGKWMNTIKYFFGWILLGLAIHLLSRLLAPSVSLVLWFLLLICAGLGLKPFTQNKGSPVIQGISLLLIVGAGFILYRASMGHFPLQASFETTAIHSHKVATNLTEIRELMEKARHKRQVVLLDFYANWCESCQIIEKNVMHAPELTNLTDKILIVKVDLSKNNADSRALLKYFNVIAPPTFLFYDANGESLTHLRWSGSINLATLLQKVQESMQTW